MALYVPDSFADSAPYPELRVEGADREYARMMLYNMGSAQSEMTAVGSYFYGSLALGSQAPELAECFHGIAVVEMRHLAMFGKLACLLGADPRLWWKCGQRMQYWSPGSVVYTREPQASVRWAISREKETILQYRGQISRIRDPYICAVLERILLDESHHVLILEKMGRSLRVGDAFREDALPSPPSTLQENAGGSRENRKSGERRAGEEKACRGSGGSMGREAWGRRR